MNLNTCRKRFKFKALISLALISLQLCLRIWYLRAYHVSVTQDTNHSWIHAPPCLHCFLRSSSKTLGRISPFPLVKMNYSHSILSVTYWCHLIIPSPPTCKLLGLKGYIYYLFWFSSNLTHFLHILSALYKCWLIMAQWKVHGFSDLDLRIESQIS